MSMENHVTQNSFKYFFAHFIVQAFKNPSFLLLNFLMTFKFL